MITNTPPSKLIELHDFELLEGGIGDVCKHCGQTKDASWNHTIKLEENQEMETMDTGAKRSVEYPVGAKFPIRLDLLFRNAAGLRRLAEVWGEGEKKYGPDNWMKGIKESCSMVHALEHLRMYLAGDTTEDHLAHCAWNVLNIIWVEENKPELMDLTKPEQVT